MQIYLVGGAVRDKLLGLKPKDNDWVVVGATPSDMLKLGFRPVFSSFPIFINPKTKEEYALARTERKTSNGYHGFETISNSDITLKDDLERRDLTINSIAQDKTGEIIDPFNGQQDIKDRILRHTSIAFKEDPLRVIRLARFETQLSDFNFTIADGTQKLITKILESKELDTLTKERLHIEFVKSLKNPAIFFGSLQNLKVLANVFPSIYKNTNLLPSKEFFGDKSYEVSSINEKIALIFYSFPLNTLANIKDELNLTNNQYKLLLATRHIYQIITTNLTAHQILQSIKNANILRNQQLYNLALKTIIKTPLSTKPLMKLKSLEVAVDEILTYDLKQLLKTTPKDQLKKTIVQQQIDTINKYIKYDTIA